MSLLRLDSHDVDEVLDVLGQAVESVTGCQLVQATFQRHEQWTTWPPGQATKPSLGSGDRTLVEDLGDYWTCTTAVAALSGSSGQLVLRHSTRPVDEQVVVIERLGHLLGSALVDAELHERDHRRAAELDSANTELAGALAALRHREAVQDEFIHLAATGTELDMATSLSRLTGCAVVVRDGFAHETTRVTLTDRSPVAGIGDPLVAVIGGRPEFGTVELVMPTDPGQSDDNASVALQYASVALGLLRGHAAAMGEMENRLSRDLLEDLVTGIPVEAAIGRAAAQGYDLRGRHDLVVSTWSSDTGTWASDRDVDRVRTAVAHQRLPCLLTRTQGMVVGLVHHGVDIGLLYEDLCRAHGDNDGLIAKGEPSSSPEHIPHAYEQAQRALTARRQSSDPRGSVAYSDLGVERILALDGNVGEVERLIDHWLADLMNYDDGHGTDLVHTLAMYLDLGGRYADTARALSVHRNTLRYRLSRITAISGHDLADVDTKLNLHLALRAWRLRRTGVR
ncbi:PucR family transcriptional regulator [Nocardioides renjunii]|uniref:PucR family transcriptional regulator n=1 Tax=Nocardioides renjunii TaxID=3095075 RepID=UPI002AFF6867|nr:helix-turn-helix domain-containing protein [Nocardioides sp. S-34]WQQ24002.1 helix-turn-helix domain-containing protein [Nocardioides sp. S-34]